MNSTIDSWVAEIASQLDLPAKRKAAVILELRTHLHADLSDRLRRGISEADATRESLAEMGAAESVAGELNHLYRFEGSLARSFLGVLIMLAGYFAMICMRGTVQAYSRLADESGLRVPWWYDQARLVTNSALVEQLFFLLPLAGIAFIVGYITQKRAWRCTLLPVFGFLGLFMLFAIVATLKAGIPDEVGPFWTLAIAAELALTTLALLVGAHLGAQLARSPSPYRRSLFALFAGIASIMPILGWVFVIVTRMTPASGWVSLFGLIFLAPIVMLMVWGLVLLARRVYRIYA